MRVSVGALMFKSYILGLAGPSRRFWSKLGQGASWYIRIVYQEVKIEDSRKKNNRGIRVRMFQTKKKKQRN